MTTPTSDAGAGRRRQVIYWRLLAAANGMIDSARNIESTTAAIAREAGLPELVLDPVIAVDTLLQRYPELKRDFEELKQAHGLQSVGLNDMNPRRALCYSK